MHEKSNSIESAFKFFTHIECCAHFLTSIGEDGTTLFPEPQFHQKNYNNYSRETLPGNPRVWVANPPFALKGSQQAFDFVEMVSNWMQNGDQFALILPSTFLNGQFQGAAQARRALTSKAQILETWNLPEKAVGLSAEQSVCVVIGEVKSRGEGITVSRTISSRKNSREFVSEKGYLGKAWLSRIPKGKSTWSSAVSPIVDINIPTIALKELYYSFTGITLLTTYPPIPTRIEGINCKPYWKKSWKGVGRLWADPEKVNPDKKFIRYERRFLKRMSEQNSKLFEKPKILVARTINNDTKDNLATHFDDKGFFPENNSFCICSRTQAQKAIENQSNFSEWFKLSERERLMWLLGILASKTARDILNSYRSPRNLRGDALENFPLPIEIDKNIINLAETLLERDKNR